ncbi:MAG TPA: hypothetical protein VFT13_01755 [Candidatus Krumholzibacteria bacterium]|nr:hypothetical protein [Candidatus Krumholzibacteria bacterium]
MVGYNEWYEEEERFWNLREILSSEYADLSDDQIEAALDGVLGEGAAENLEGFWKQAKNIGGTLGKYAQGALPGVIQGATAGAALGPMGIVGGALSGGAISVAQQATAKRPPATPRRAGAATTSAAPLPNGSAAAGQLLQLLSRPEIVQSLLAMAMGAAGKPSVRVGQTPVPVGAVTNLLGALANQASVEHHALTAGEVSGSPAYLLDSHGEFVCDPTSATERAGVLLELLADSDPWADAGESNDDESGEFDDVDDYPDNVDELYDGIELAELYAGDELEY